MLELDVHFRRGDFALNITMDIECDAVGLIGPSGCGKTTLLHCIAGLIHPDSGSILFRGQTLFDSSAGINVPVHKRRVGVVFQEGRLLPHRSVRANLHYGLKLVPRVDRRYELQEIARLLEITEILDRPANSISGGQARRVAIGRSILACPGLLLLDEPLTGLDKRLRDEIMPLLGKLPVATGIPIIYVSHQMEEITCLTREILQLQHGRLVFRGDLRLNSTARNSRYMRSGLGA